VKFGMSNSNREGTGAARERSLLSVIVPAYNEESIIQRSLSAICEYLAGLETEYRWELIVVNDGSTDATGEIAESFASKRDHVVVLHHRFNFKLGQALRFAFNRSRGDYVVVLDVDLSYSPDHIGSMLARMKQTGAKIVIASPYTKGGKVSNVPWFRKLLSFWANRFLALTAAKDSQSDKLTTITGMVRAYDGDFLRRMSLKSMDVEINPEIIYKAKILRARIVECPAHLNWLKESENRSDTKRRKSTIKVARSMLHHVLSGYIFRPFMFFIVPGAVIFALSLYPLTWTVLNTIREYRRIANQALTFDYRLSEAIGTAFRTSPHAFIVGGIALLVAIQLTSLGLLSLQKKRYFEELYYLNTTIHRDLRRKNDQ
jgi:glycosyltransferase involved in cell wall biosynthesis